MKYKISLLIITIFLNINVFALEEVKLVKCVDGDTANFLVDGKERKARLLAVDTPESVHPTKKTEFYGKEASEYTCKMLTDAKKIEIEYDPKSDKTDKYDRLLVWIYTDGELLQENLIKKGYAKVAYIYKEYNYVENLCKLENIARNKKIGMWEKNYNQNSYCFKDGENKENEKVEEKKEKLTINDILYLIGATILLYLLKEIRKRLKKIKL